MTFDLLNIYQKIQRWLCKFKILAQPMRCQYVKFREKPKVTDFAQIFPKDSL